MDCTKCEHAKGDIEKGNLEFNFICHHCNVIKPWLEESQFKAKENKE